MSPLTLAPAPPVVAALPVNPYDGQEVYFLADAAGNYGGPHMWRLRFRAASAFASKWEPVGSTQPLSKVVLTQEGEATTGVWKNLPTDGPSIAAPLAGDYAVTYAATVRGNVAGASFGQVGAAIGNTNPAFGQQFSPNGGGFFGTVSGDDILTGVAAAALMKLRYWNDNAAPSPQFLNRVLWARPIRLG